MKKLLFISFFLAAAGAFNLRSSAATLVDDTWATGVRTNQNLPNSSAWFTSSAANVAVFTNKLSFTNTTGSSQWYTYFTTNGSPVHLKVGDTLTVSLSFIPNGVGAQNSSKNFRIGLYNSAGSTRPATDAGLPTNPGGYFGYALFSNFGLTWGASPDIRKRTVVSNNDPLNASGDSAVIGSFGLTTGTTAFSNGVPYNITITIACTDPSTNIITATFSGGGLTNSVTGTDSSGIYTNFDMVLIRPSNASSTATNFIFTEFTVTGPVGTPDAPLIVNDTQPMTVETAETAVFSVAAAGAQPLRYQWYTNATSGPLAGATNAYLLLTNVQLSQAANYFVIVSNSLSTATSSMAGLTVTVPVFSSRGLVVDDTWNDGSHNNGPVATNNSIWYASASGSFLASQNLVQALPDPATARLWVGYFTDDPTMPIDLAVGDAIKVSLVFTPTNTAPQNTGGVRFGLFNYSNGGNRLTQDDSASPGSIGDGLNVRGYILTQNFGPTFGINSPMQIYVRTNLISQDLMGTTSDFLSLGSGPSGQSNAPAFIDGTQYTLQFKVTRTAAAAMNITTTVTGGPLNINLSETDTNYNYRRFDAFAIRANRTTDSAGEIDITEFKVEVVPGAVSVTPFKISSVQLFSTNSIVLTWPSVSGANYQVQSSPALSPAAWVTNATLTATGLSTSYTNAPISGNTRFYRVVNTP